MKRRRRPYRKPGSGWRLRPDGAAVEAGAVHRPGCKVDTVPIVEGEQGPGNSSAGRGSFSTRGSPTNSQPSIILNKIIRVM